MKIRFTNFREKFLIKLSFQVTLSPIKEEFYAKKINYTFLI